MGDDYLSKQFERELTDQDRKYLHDIRVTPDEPVLEPMPAAENKTSFSVKVPVFRLCPVCMWEIDQCRCRPKYQPSEGE